MIQNILNYNKLSNTEKLKLTRTVFYTIFILFSIYFVVDIFYFKYFKTIEFPWYLIFMFLGITFANYEKKMKKKINDEMINQVNNKENSSLE